MMKTDHYFRFTDRYFRFTDQCPSLATHNFRSTYHYFQLTLMITERKLSIHFFTNFVPSSPDSFMNGSRSNCESCVWYVSKYHTYIHTYWYLTLGGFKSMQPMWMWKNSYTTGSFTHSMRRTKDRLDLPPPSTGSSLWVSLLSISPSCPPYTCCYYCIKL